MPKDKGYSKPGRPSKKAKMAGLKKKKETRNAIAKRKK